MTDTISTIDGARAGTLDGNLLSEGRQEAASETLGALKLLDLPQRVELKLWNVVHNRKERSQNKCCKKGRPSEVKLRGFGEYFHRLQTAGWTSMSYADFVKYVLDAIPRARTLVNPKSLSANQLPAEKLEQLMYLDNVKAVFDGQAAAKKLGSAARNARASARKKDANHIAAAAHSTPMGQPYAIINTSTHQAGNAPLLASALANRTLSHDDVMRVMQQRGGSVAPTAAIGHLYSHPSIMPGPPPTATTADPESIDVFESVLQTLRELDEMKKQQAMWTDATSGRDDAEEASTTVDDDAMLLLSTMKPAHDGVDPRGFSMSAGAPSHQDLARMLPPGAPPMMTAPSGYDWGPGMMASPSDLASIAGPPIVPLAHFQGMQGSDLRRQGQLDGAIGSSSETMAVPTTVNASSAPPLDSAANALGPASQRGLGDAAKTQSEGEQAPTLQPSIGGASPSAQEVVHHPFPRAPHGVIQPGIALSVGTAADPILINLAACASHDPTLLVSECLRRIDRVALGSATSDGLLTGLQAQQGQGQLVNVNSLMGTADDPLAPLAALCTFYGAVADWVRAISLVYTQAFGSVTQQLPPSAYATPAITDLANSILSARRHCSVVQSASSAGMGPTSVSSAATQMPSMTSADADNASASSAEVHGRFLTAEDTPGPHRPDETPPSHAEPDELSELHGHDTWAGANAQLEVAKAARDAHQPGPMHPRPTVSPPPSPKRPRQPSPARPHGPPHTAQSEAKSDTFAAPAPAGASEEIFPDGHPMRIPL